MTDLTSLLGELSDNNVRIDGMWPIPQVEMPEAVIELFELDDELPSWLADLAKSLDDNQREALIGDGNSYDRREAWDTLFGDMSFRGQSGFVVAVSTPVLDYDEKLESASFSWGHYHTEKLFAADLASLQASAVTWADECDERDKARKTKRLKAAGAA
jgi:hypothetical protein